ncbi:hypothetical protein H6P81_002031 [Aristolochia fimbriata]|uniref:Cohesin subunit SA-3 n=1 Tax=Aristolochia fimbriata TaxID=158543 RepID=A0AAV7F8U7_ARIFI|nr:hypothetical protein H6P81_002031 [Aristolochia fimbriata]
MDSPSPVASISLRRSKRRRGRPRASEAVSAQANKSKEKLDDARNADEESPNESDKDSERSDDFEEVERRPKKRINAATSSRRTTEQSLFEIIKSNGKLIPNAVKAWVERYENNSKSATVELLTTLFESCGAKYQLDEASLDEISVDDVVLALVGLAKNGEVDDLCTSKSKEYKNFKENLSSFWDNLVIECQNGPLFDQILFEKCMDYVIALSCTPPRVYRVVGSIVGLQLVTSFITVAKALAGQRETTQRQLIAEKKKRHDGPRLESLSNRLSATHEKITAAEEMMRKIYSGLFMHRYRDVDPDIRQMSIKALGVWIVSYPSLFLQDIYLKYLGWMLNDKVAAVRKTSIHALQNLYEVDDIVPSLSLFTERFCTRMVELADDIDVSVAVSAIGLLKQLLRHELLAEDELGPLYDLLIDEPPPIRRAIGELVYEHLIAQKFASSQSGSRGEDGEASEVHLARLLQILREFSKDPILSVYVIDDVWDDMKAMKDWKCIISMLLDENPSVELTDVDATSLVRLLCASIKKAVGEKIVPATDNRKQYYTKAQKEALESSRREITSVMIKRYSQLLLKYLPDKEKVSLLVELTMHLKLELYSLKRQEQNFKTVLQLIKDAFFKHGEKETLRSCVKAISFCVTESKADLQDFAENKLKELENELILKIKSAMSDVTMGDDDYLLLVNLKRLYELQLSRFVPIEGFYEDMAGICRNFRNTDSVVLCFVLLNMYLHVIWCLHSINGENICEASVFSLRAKRDTLLDLLEHMLDGLLEVKERRGWGVLACRVIAILVELWCLLKKSRFLSTELEALGFSPNAAIIKKFWKVCEQRLDIADETEDEDMNEEYIEETNREAVMISAAKLVATNTVPKDYLGSEIVSHFVMHGTNIADIVKYLISVFYKYAIDDIPDLFLEAMWKAYMRHAEDTSRSDDDSLTHKSFVGCKDLAARLSGLFIGAARNKHRSHIQKIVTEGIKYAFVDAPKHLIFLEAGVLPFVSKLPTSDAIDILKDVEQRSEDFNTDEDPSGWRPYYTFVDHLQEKYSKNDGLHDDKEGRLARGQQRRKKPRNVIGKRLFDGQGASEDEDSISGSDQEEEEDEEEPQDEEQPLIHSLRSSASKLKLMRISQREKKECYNYSVAGNLTKTKSLPSGSTRKKRLNMNRTDTPIQADQLTNFERHVRKNYRRASLISRKNRQFGYYPITRGPEPVSSIVSSRLRLHCTQSLPSLADKRNLQWQKKDPNPEKCLDKGQQVTRCVLSLLKGLHERCSKEMDAYAGCMYYHTNEFELCRKEQQEFEKACPCFSLQNPLQEEVEWDSLFLRMRHVKEEVPYNSAFSMDFSSAIEELHKLGSHELSKLLKDSDNLTIQITTSKGSVLQIDMEKLAWAFPLHLLAVLVSPGGNITKLKYLLKGIRLLHSMCDLASRYARLEQILLEDVKFSEQMLDLVFYMLVVLASCEQESCIGSAVPVVHSALVACSLYLLTGYISSQWQDLVHVLLLHPKVDIFMDVSFDAVRVAVKFFQIKLSALNTAVSFNRSSLPTAESTVRKFCLQLEASLQFLQSLFQQKVFRERFLKQKELCRNGNLLLLAKAILKLNIPSHFKEASSIAAAVSRMKSKILSILLLLCETESISYLDEVASSSRSMSLAKSVGFEVLELLKAAFGAKPRQPNSALDNTNPRGLVLLNSMRLADIFSDDSNFRSFIVANITQILADVLSLPHEDFLSGWCSSDFPVMEEDATLEYDPVVAAGLVLNLNHEKDMNAARPFILHNMRLVSLAQQRTAFLVKIIANLHCFVPSICEEQEKDRFINKIIECLQIASAKPLSRISFSYNEQKASTFSQNLCSLLDHAVSLIPTILNEEDLQLLSVFFEKLQRLLPSLYEDDRKEDSDIKDVEDIQDKKFEASSHDAEDWAKFPNLDLGDEPQEVASSIKREIDSTAMEEAPRFDYENGDLKGASDSSNFSGMNFKGSSFMGGSTSGRFREVDRDARDGETSRLDVSSMRGKGGIDQIFDDGGFSELKEEHMEDNEFGVVQENGKSEASQSEEKQTKKRKRNIMNEKQIMLIERALVDEPEMQRNAALVQSWVDKLSDHGAEITTSQLKNWLNNRKAKLARAAREARAPSEGETTFTDKVTGHCLNLNYDSPESPGEDYYVPTPTARSSNPSTSKFDGGHGDFSSQRDMQHNTPSNNLDRYEPGQFIALMDGNDEEIGRGKVCQVEGRWQGKDLEEAGICVVDVLELKVERWTKIPHPSEHAGMTFDEAEAKNGNHAFISMRREDLPLSDIRTGGGALNLILLSTGSHSGVEVPRCNLVQISNSAAGIATGLTSSLRSVLRPPPSVAALAFFDSKYFEAGEVQLSEARMLCLKDLVPAATNTINTLFILLDKGSTTKEGQGRTCLALVADETASVHFQLWGNECDAFQAGDIINLSNGIFSYHRGNLVLRAGKKGKAEKVGEFTKLFVETPNMSEIKWGPDPTNPKKLVQESVISPHPRIFSPKP